MTSSMEKILGASIGHSNTVPGTVAVYGKEFVYFSDDGSGAIRKQFKALTQHTNPPHAQQGSVTSQGCRLILPNGLTFHSIAYHGDLEGWRKDIEEGASALGLLTAKIDQGNLVLSDGRLFALAECEVKFD